MAVRSARSYINSSRDPVRAACNHYFHHLSFRSFVTIPPPVPVPLLTLDSVFFFPPSDQRGPPMKKLNFTISISFATCAPSRRRGHRSPGAQKTSWWSIRLLVPAKTVPEFCRLYAKANPARINFHRAARTFRTISPVRRAVQMIRWRPTWPTSLNRAAARRLPICLLGVTVWHIYVSPAWPPPSRHHFTAKAVARYGDHRKRSEASAGQSRPLPYSFGLHTRAFCSGLARPRK